MPITAPSQTVSTIGPIRAEIQAQVEACLVLHYNGAAATRQHCFLEDGTAVQSAEKPYAALSIAGGKGVSFDMNSRTRPIMPVVIELMCDPNTQTGATLRNEQSDLLIEQIASVFYITNNWARLVALSGFIDFNPVNLSVSPDGKYAVMEYTIELDWPYV